MKLERHNKIIELINEYQIETQEELAARLKAAGYHVTQATVSRDIRELNLIKAAEEGGRQKYIRAQYHTAQNHPAQYETSQEMEGLNEKYVRVLKDGFVSMDMAMNILVIKTVSGMAMAVAAALDAMEWNEIVGSIAGDDTIMCAVRRVEETYIVMERLKQLIS